MSGKFQVEWGRGAVVAALAIVAMLALAANGRANTGNILEPQRSPPEARDGWQAGPCTADIPVRCSPETPSQFFKTAGGHPPVAFVQFTVRHETVVLNEIEPLLEPLARRIPRTLRVDLPPGLSVNPNASAEKCSLADFFHEVRGAVIPACGQGSKIGESIVDLVIEAPEFLGRPFGARLLPEARGIDKVDLFNLQPPPGQPALFGFVLAGGVKVFLRPEISWESDFHESFTIEGLPAFNTVMIGNVFAPIAILDARLITTGNAGDGTLATNPTTCFNADEPQFKHVYSSWMRMESFGEPDPFFPFGSSPLESALPPGIHPEGCASIPFHPSLEIDPGTAEVDSPAPLKVAIKTRVEVPQRGGGPIAESHLRKAEVELPEGMGLNPAGAAGLLACSDAQFRKAERVSSNNCPARSVVGTAQIRTPVLDQPLLGNVYVGAQKSTDPASGEEFRILVEAKSDQLGVVVRLIGGVKADPVTGQLTAVFDEQEVSPLFGSLPRGLPQVPFESVRLDLDTPRSILTSPPTCAAGAATGRLEPWARPGTQVSVSAPIGLTSLPGGGRCPESMAARTFSPLYTARPNSSRAGAYTPFRIHLDRFEGQQEVKRLNLALPKGLIGRLAGIPYCSEQAIAAARANSGLAEQRARSCPAGSSVGTTTTAAGSGGEPLVLPGTVYLAGPYQGAPLSLVAITPAVSGPFDLGTVVVRVALDLDQTTAQITATSDVLPDVFGGVKLDLRSIDFNLDRPQFMLNPTSCPAQATDGAISGAGGDPTNPALFSKYRFRAPFQATGCGLLNFAPKLVTTLAGPTKRNRYPRLTATLRTKDGEANLAKATVTLPHTFQAAQEHIADVCTRPKLAAHACPDSAVYGDAEARSPLLDDPLKGPVYLVPGGNPLPDLVADLRGQVEIQVHGVIRSVGGRIQVAFDTPDVPVREFTLHMAGGKKGLIVNSADICRVRKPGAVQIAAQNGKQVTNNRYRFNLASCKKHKAKKHKKHKKHRKH